MVVYTGMVAWVGVVAWGGVQRDLYCNVSRNVSRNVLLCKATEEAYELVALRPPKVRVVRVVRVV